MRGKVVHTPKGPRYFLDGKPVTKAAYDRAFPSKLDELLAVPEELRSGGAVGQATTTWPMVSEALAVQPSQVAEANARNKKHGVAARYDAEGFCHIPTRAERAKLIRLERTHGGMPGLCDNRGGYGDG